jgi:hypothetical protein
MKLKILYLSLLAFCSLNAQVITNSGFESLDLGVMGNSGASMPDWYAQTNTTSASDCGGVTGAIPTDEDIQVIDEGGNKAVAIFANGKKCNNNDGSVANQAAIMAQKFTNLVAGQTYDISMDVKYSGAPITTGNMNFQIRPEAAYNYAKRLPWLGSDDPRAAYISATAIVNTQGEYVTMTHQFTVPADGKVKWINKSNEEVEIDGGIDGVDIFLCVVKGQGVIPNATDYITIDNVTVTEGLSYKDFSMFQFNLFPNPASSRLNLKANTSIDDVVVSNTLGQKVKQLHFGTREAFIDVSDLNKGIYIITTKIDGQSGTYRFIKK